MPEVHRSQTLPSSSVQPEPQHVLRAHTFDVIDNLSEYSFHSGEEIREHRIHSDDSEFDDAASNDWWPEGKEKEQVPDSEKVCQACEVRELATPARYQLVHTHLKCINPATCLGLVYRNSKSLSDYATGEKRGADWNDTVYGLDEGDGWLKVDDRFLPMEVDGCPVIIKVDGDGDAAHTTPSQTLLQRAHTAVSSWSEAHPSEKWKWAQQALARAVQYLCDGGSASNARIDWPATPQTGKEGTFVLRVDHLRSHQQMKYLWGHRGLHFFRTKSLDDPTATSQPWGSVVSGIDEGDGWLSTGDGYLPMVLEGCPVLYEKLPDQDESGEDVVSIGKEVTVTSNVRRLEIAVRTNLLSWPSGPSGRLWTSKLGFCGTISRIDVEDHCVELAMDGWVPIRALVGFENWSREAQEVFDKGPHPTIMEHVVEDYEMARFWLQEFARVSYEASKHKVHYGKACVLDPEGEPGVYIGPLLDGNAHGIGKLEYDDDVKTGDWFIGKFMYGKMVEGVCYHKGDVRFTMRDGFWTNDGKAWKVDPEILVQIPIFEEAIAESIKKSQEPPPATRDERLFKWLDDTEQWCKEREHPCMMCAFHALSCVCTNLVICKRHLQRGFCKDGDRCIPCDDHVQHCLAGIGSFCDRHEHCHRFGIPCFHGLQKVCDRLVALKRRALCQDHPCEVCCGHCISEACHGLVKLADRPVPPKKAAEAPKSDEDKADAEPVEEPEAPPQRVLAVGDFVRCKDSQDENWKKGVVVKADEDEPLKVRVLSWKAKRGYSFECVEFDSEAEEETKKEPEDVVLDGKAFDAKVGAWVSALEHEVEICHWHVMAHAEVVQAHGNHSFEDIDGDKGEYVGHLRHGLAHGIGKVIYHGGASADYFIGEFKGGNMYEGVCYRGTNAVYTMSWGRWTHDEVNWTVEEDIVAKVPMYQADILQTQKRLGRSQVLVELGDQVDIFERMLLHVADKPRSGTEDFATVIQRKYNRKGIYHAIDYIKEHLPTGSISDWM